MFYKKNKQSGYTLLEIVVAVGIFAMMIVSAAAIFQKVMDGQRLAIAAHNTQESVRYTMELISKEIRNAQVDAGVCPNVADNAVFAVGGDSTLYFKNQYDECVTYTQDGNRFKITRGADSGYVTPVGIAVSNLLFYLKSANQPSVTIVMQVNNLKFGGRDLYQSQINIQTTVSSRYYE